MHCFQVNHNEERLTTPLVRGKDGKLQPASWDEAMNLIVQRTRQLRAQSTTHAIGFYTSGQLFLEEYYVLAMIGCIWTATRVCAQRRPQRPCANPSGRTDSQARTKTLMSRNASFSWDTTWQTHRRQDIFAHSQQRRSERAGGRAQRRDSHAGACSFFFVHTLLWPSFDSTAQSAGDENHGPDLRVCVCMCSVLWSRILDRLAGPSPPSVIVLDPRETTTAAAATVHLANRFGTNVAVLNGLAHLIVAGGHVQQEWVDKHTVGYASLKTTTAKYTPEYVEELSGIPADKLREAARLLVTSPSVLSTVLQGVYQSHQATAAACAVNNLHLLLAQIGKPGCGILQMNGQPTAQNNREAGANGEFPAFRNYQNPDHMQSLADVWKVEPYHIAHWQVPTHIMQMMAHIEQGKSVETFQTPLHPRYRTQQSGLA
jgi:anaerobic selenocysteine-containing dehydrogenase